MSTACCDRFQVKVSELDQSNLKTWIKVWLLSAFKAAHAHVDHLVKRKPSQPCVEG